MNVILKPELQRFVDEKVKAGQYGSADEIVNEALEVLRDHEEFSPEHESYLRQEIGRGIEQLDAGQTADFNAETIIAEERDQLARGKRKA
jgi:antitoxin ParD1/3/4